MPTDASPEELLQSMKHRTVDVNHDMADAAAAAAADDDDDDNDDDDNYCMVPKPYRSRPFCI